MIESHMKKPNAVKVGLSRNEAKRLGLHEYNGLPWLNANIEKLLVDNEIDRIAEVISNAFSSSPKLVSSCLVRIHFGKDGLEVEVLEVER